MLRNMRTPLLAAALGLTLAGCFVGDAGMSSTGGGDDDDGMGSQNPPDTSLPTSAAVNVTVDKATVTTELRTANPIAVTVTGAGGFHGDVTLAASMVDANDAALTGWTVNLVPAKVTLSENGTAAAMATVTIPSMSANLTGTLKVTSTSAATQGTTSASSALTAVDAITFPVKFDAATNGCIYPADGGTIANPVVIARTTKIRFFNTGTQDIVIHVNSASGGVPITHQGQAPGGQADPKTEANTAYEQTPIGPSPAGGTSWYCHDLGPDLKANNPRFNVL